jgi:hypothetical protein
VPQPQKSVTLRPQPGRVPRSLHEHVVALENIYIYTPTKCTHFVIITVMFQYKINSYMFRASMTHQQELHSCIIQSLDLFIICNTWNGRRFIEARFKKDMCTVIGTACRSECHVANLQATVHISVSVHHSSMNLRRFHILQIIMSNGCINNCEIPNDGQMSPKHVGVYVY